MTTSQIQHPTLNVPRADSWLRRRRPLVKVILIVAVVAVPVALVAAATLGWDRGRAWLNLPGPRSDLLTYTVQPVNMRITVLEGGTLESASLQKVFSQVEGQVAIISLVPEGTPVKAGDLVVELDSSALEARRLEQQIIVEKARATFVQAEQAANVAQSQADSDISKAELALEFADLDLNKYLEGDYPQQLRVAQSEKTLADEELRRAREQLRYSEQLKNDGYLSEGEYEADRLKAVHAEVKLELAQVRERLLVEYTFARTKRELESRVEEARRALARARSMAQSAVTQAQTTMKSEQATFQLEERRLRYLEEQIAGCTMRAPQDGVVTYPVPEDDDLVELYIKQGAIIRERQHVFSIPDTDVMQIGTSIHEAMVNRVKPGMSARIWVDVYPNLVLKGQVINVSPLPDPEDWRRTTVKFYETKVALVAQPAEELRPGMTAKVEILVDRVNDVLAVPVQSVLQRGEAGICYVRRGSRHELRRLILGRSNDQMIEVVDGLTALERVVLSPDLLGIPSDVFRTEQAESEADAGESALVLESTSEPVEEDPGVEVEYQAVLIGGTDAVGEAEYEVTTFKDGRVEYKFEVVLQRGAADVTWNVIVDGVTVGELITDSYGNGEAEWKSKKGTFPENFPSGVGPGSAIEVGGVLSGQLRR